MKVWLVGFFKSADPKFEQVKIPNVSEALLKSAVGFNARLDLRSDRDVWNALLGKCAQLGWYRNGGWRPHGPRKHLAKKDGDILGVCVSFGGMCAYNAKVWLYCSREFEDALLEDFVLPETRLRLAAGYNGICGAVIAMDRLPNREWLDRFCQTARKI